MHVLTMIGTVVLGILILIGALLVLVIGTLSLSYGVRVSNLKDGTTSLWIRIGWLRIRIMPKKPLSEAKKQKKEAKKQKKKQKKALRKEKKRLAAIKKAEKELLHPKKKKKRKTRSKAAKQPKNVRLLIRAALATLADYDYPYLKLITVRHAALYFRVGGANAAEVGRRYARIAEAFGAAYPVLMRALRIKRHNIAVAPDFVWRRTELQYDVTVTLRPIRLAKAALVFWKGFRRNRNFYRDDTETVSITNTKRRKTRRPAQRTENRRK